MSEDRANELLAALLKAEDTPAIVAALACAVWHNSHDGDECPANRIPDEGDLTAWLRECPDTDRTAAGELLAPLFDDRSASWLRVSVDDTPALFAFVKTPGERAGLMAGVTPFDVEAVHERWRTQPEPRPRHPLAPLVAAWQRLAPVQVASDTRADRRILPALKVLGPAPERERGLLFGGLVEDRQRVADLPLFPELEPTGYRVPLLEIVDAAGVPLRSRGKGAPLEARLLVRGGLLMIRPEDRGLTTVRVAITVSELLDALYPRPVRPNGTVPKRRFAEYWPGIEEALRTVHNFTVTDATGGRWFPMALRRLPANGTPSPDDLVVVDLAPPPGATAGATVDLPALDLMGVQSGPKWCAYIAARSLIWVPGTTRRPVPRARGRWGWSSNPEDYPVLRHKEDMRRLAFGTNDRGNRMRDTIIEPWSDLPDVVLVPDQVDERTGTRGHRLVPAEAAKALLKLGYVERDPDRHRNDHAPAHGFLLKPAEAAKALRKLRRKGT